MLDDRQRHWENVYSTKRETEVSWFEDTPTLSVSLIRDAGVGADASVVDVGGGASRLVDALIDDGQAHVTVLDLSAAALATARERLGYRGDVAWVVNDVTTWEPVRSFDLWHDRAAFHFLTDPGDQRRYVRVLRRPPPAVRL